MKKSTLAYKKNLHNDWVLIISNNVNTWVIIWKQSVDNKFIAIKKVNKLDWFSKSHMTCVKAEMTKIIWSWVEFWYVCYQYSYSVYYYMGFPGNSRITWNNQLIANEKLQTVVGIDVVLSFRDFLWSIGFV